ncbi:unnamed protein product [Bursaphelenchus xylophilus]|uniref:(pine wood nematode) hypothetical protein n=1 Tax=Bursaphelenchus xylophilus TaxID=6326 RepID=A0A1I7RR46_BURXY|nr:unnamed protein product [Bursaphelenchus xylophilus]CAG9130837.1 unnamed protein product [Bursaphelenchus xylophilus]
MPFGQIVTEPARAKRSFVYCYICGRMFGTKSIDIHQPQCLQKWRLENQKLPKHQRRTEPVQPEIVRHADGQVNHDATNAAMYEAAQLQLVGCEHCGRTFQPDRLPIHQRSCTAERPHKGLVGALKSRNSSPARY